MVEKRLERPWPCQSSPFPSNKGLSAPSHGLPGLGVCHCTVWRLYCSPCPVPPPPCGPPSQGACPCSWGCTWGCQPLGLKWNFSPFLLHNSLATLCSTGPILTTPLVSATHMNTDSATCLSSAFRKTLSWWNSKSSNTDSATCLSSAFRKTLSTVQYSMSSVVLIFRMLKMVMVNFPAEVCFSKMSKIFFSHKYIIATVSS